MRRNEDSIKQKANGDEIDSMSTLINDLYERIMEMQRGGATTGAGEEHAMRPSISLPFPTRNMAPRDNQKVKELTELV
eukprot:CAMPEP_0202961684 /NCGR_PEP_ID=MMETSP1396-20130829/5750_1 /ASSEMBLY_ACC=CAM_ASM_000872 /TAXON_ID= /ORGANISM="Pseudokeronopsis sp., Strain Brazil" /LENGTH=77 /DNA_ID=CAMNT_0049681691 /DNA_START=1192 /DNA_END=1425 /DNA_ORIENTATION=-